jgi:hypothetical protein
VVSRVHEPSPPWWSGWFPVTSRSGIAAGRSQPVAGRRRTHSCTTVRCVTPDRQGSSACRRRRRKSDAASAPAQRRKLGRRPGSSATRARGGRPRRGVPEGQPMTSRALARDGDPGELRNCRENALSPARAPGPHPSGAEIAHASPRSGPGRTTLARLPRGRSSRSHRGQRFSTGRSSVVETVWVNPLVVSTRKRTRPASENCSVSSGSLRSAVPTAKVVQVRPWSVLAWTA